MDLDAAIWPLVEAHRARGHDVEWVPNGLLAAGRTDDISEVVNILLNNAAAHAPGHREIEVRRVEGSAEIAVSDSGPESPVPCPTTSSSGGPADRRRRARASA